MSVSARPSTEPPKPARTDFLAGGSEMAELVHAKDWSATPLGPIDTWPQSLKTTVSLCLASNFPINIIWGPHNTQIYNDGYRLVCGDSHPRALGEAYDVTWASAWPAIGTPFERARGGETSFLENQRMFLTRNGYLEETFFTFSLSPIRDESGGIGGVFHPVTETTATMLLERRTRALRDLTTRLGLATDATELSAAATDTLSAFAFDLPFLLWYEISAEDGRYRLVHHHGLASGTPASPEIVALDAAPWPLLTGARQPVEIDGLARLIGDQPCGPYEEGCERAFILPLHAMGQEKPAILLIAGVSARLPFDDPYRGFYELIAAALSAALSTVRAREDERRRAEALAEIDRAKTQFFSNISHEFRTPLTLMLGPLEEALARGTLGPADQDGLEVVYRNSQRLLRLVNSLLDFSRIEAGRAQASFEQTEIATLTAELSSNFRSATERAGLALVIDAEPLSEPVYLDREMWEKIVLNLLSNAFKFTFEGEIRVTVRAVEQGGAADIIISDTGTGIPPDALPHLFERFYRVEGARGRSFEGSGIGLALVQELVAIHGGDISVTSDLGRGSAFRIRLPTGSAHLAQDRIAAAPQLPATRRAAIFVEEALRWLPDDTGAVVVAPDGKGTGRVVLADDNADMRGYVRRLLSAEGFVVECWADGEAALAAVRQDPPDLILSDVMMPKLDGFGLLAALRADPALSDIPFILLSARAGEEARVEGIEAGADDYLTKPFSARELVARVAVNLNLARDRREAALRALNADLEMRVLEQSMERGRMWTYSPDLLSVINLKKATFDRVNPAWTLALGWGPDTIEGAAYVKLLHPDDAAASAAAFDEARGGKPVLRFENRYRDTEGAWRWLSWVAVPEGEKLYSSARDITSDKLREIELAAAQEALRQSQKMEAVGQLTGGIAHDFNNMLAVIIGSLDLLVRRAGTTDPRIRRYADAALEGATRAATLTQRLLAFSRQQPLRPKPVDANKLVSNMSELIRGSIGGDIRLETVLASGLWRVHADPNQLENMLINLAVNARDAMLEGGWLTIETQNTHLDARYVSAHLGIAAGQYVLIAVTDTGCGMPTEVVAKAFDPFFTTKPIGKGTGLGLSQVYGFVKQSGGHVKIYSEEGEGTTVKVYLPRLLGDAVDAGTTEGPLSDLPQGDRQEVILVVEDEPAVRQFAVDALTELGYRVLDADGAAAALRLLDAHAEISMLFTDIIMPDVNGAKLAEEARRRRADLKVLFTTGYTRNAVVHNGVLDAGVELIGKPYTLEELAAKVRTVLDAPG